jgi:hypothetical protein
VPGANTWLAVRHRRRFAFVAAAFRGFCAPTSVSGRRANCFLPLILCLRLYSSSCAPFASRLPCREEPLLPERSLFGVAFPGAPSSVFEGGAFRARFVRARLKISFRGAKAPACRQTGLTSRTERSECVALLVRHSLGEGGCATLRFNCQRTALPMN